MWHVGRVHVRLQSRCTMCVATAALRVCRFRSGCRTTWSLSSTRSRSSRTSRWRPVRCGAVRCRAVRCGADNGLQHQMSTCTCNVRHAACNRHRAICNVERTAVGRRRLRCVAGNGSFVLRNYNGNGWHWESPLLTQPGTCAHSNNRQRHQPAQLVPLRSCAYRAQSRGRSGLAIIELWRCFTMRQQKHNAAIGQPLLPSASHASALACRGVVVLRAAAARYAFALSRGMTALARIATQTRPLCCNTL